MRKWFTSSLYRKMFVSFLIVALVPLLAVYFYINSRYSTRMKEDAANLQQMAERNTALLLEDFLMKEEYISNLFFSSSTQRLLKEPDSDGLGTYNLQMKLEHMVRVNLDLYKVMDSVEQVTFVKRNGTAYHVLMSSEPVLLESEEIDHSSRYKNHYLSSIGGVRDGKLVYVRKIDDVEVISGELGYLYVVFDKNEIDRIFADLSSVMDTRVVVRNQSGELLYANFEDAGDWLQGTGSKAVPFEEGVGKNGEDSWVSWDYGMENFGLTVTFYDEVKRLNFNIQELNYLTEILILMTIAVILAASFAFSKTIVNPVLRLRDRLLRIRSGDFKARVQVETNDELGDVELAFNDMAAEMDRLVNQVYATEIKEKEAAIAALQAQINPHFLYNTLDMIKSMADIYGAGEVGDVIVALSGLFRYATHTSVALVTVREELDNLGNYMKIVNMRLGGRITCTVDVPDELLQARIIKVCLQPIVENSVSHGLRRGGRERRIAVRIFRESADIVIEVWDDGVGMDEERIAEIRNRLALPPREDTGTKPGNVGLKNIHDRIRLYYGNEYGVTIESRLGEGTTVTVRYPAEWQA